MVIYTLTNFSQKFREINFIRFIMYLVGFTNFVSSDSKFLVFPHCSNWGRGCMQLQFSLEVWLMILNLQFAKKKKKKKKKTCRGSSFTCIRSKCTNNASASVARATSIWNYANCNWSKKLNKAFIETCLISRRIIRRITNRQMWEQFEENWDK